MTYRTIERRVPENPDDYNSSNQRTLRYKGIAEQFIHTDSQRYELFETVERGHFGRTLGDYLIDLQGRYPTSTLIACQPTALCIQLVPACIGHIYVQADTPRVFGWDMSRPKKGEE